MTRTARSITHNHGPATDSVTLGYDDRFLRRKVLTTDAGASILVDLEQTTSLNAGDALVCTDGALIAIRAAEEALMKITGPSLPHLAWHIGNRHCPCQVAADHLLIRRDHVLRAMLEGLGAQVTDTLGPFTPEGGAYGHGRTLSHAH